MESILTFKYLNRKEYTSDEIDEIIKKRDQKAHILAKKELIEDFKDNIDYYTTGKLTKKDLYEPVKKIRQIFFRKLKPDADILNMIEEYYQEQGYRLSNKFEVCYIYKHNHSIDDIRDGLKNNTDIKDVHKHNHISIDKFFSDMLTKYNAAAIIIKNLTLGIYSEDKSYHFRAAKSCCACMELRRDTTEFGETEKVEEYLQQLNSAAQLIKQKEEELKKGYKEIWPELSSEIAFTDIKEIRKLEKLKNDIISTLSK